jgi:TRAP-type C4-dicarboxylate transport system permease small subunit
VEVLSQPNPLPERRASGLLGVYQATMDTIAFWFMAAARIFLVLMLLLICLEIILRNFFLISTKVADEYSGYLTCWATLCGFLYAARNDYFIRVEFMLTRLRGPRRELALLFGSLCGLIVTVVVCYASVLLVWNSYRFHSTSQQYSETLMAIPQGLLPVSFFLLAVVYLEDVIRRIARRIARLVSRRDEAAAP